MTVSATIQISFGAAGTTADGHLSAEIDARPTGLNGGVTTFAPGTPAYFLVYESDNVTHDPPIPSAGTVVAAGTSLLITKEEDIQFADTDTATLPIPSEAVTGVTWLGTALGTLTLQADKVTVKASASGVAVAKVTYTARADAYRLNSPATLAGLTDFSILVFILGHLIP